MAHAIRRGINRSGRGLEFHRRGGGRFSLTHGCHVPAKLAEPVLDLAERVAARGFRVRGLADGAIGVGQGRGVRLVMVDQNSSPSR